MHYIAQNLKHLRKQHGWTQDQLAHQLGVKRSLIGAYEEGRADPRISFLMLVCQKFDCSLDQLIGMPLDESNSSKERYTGTTLRVLPIPVEKESNSERISLVPIRAAAGYLNGFGDVEFIESLPTFDMPFPEVSRGKTYRVFQTKGDSMLPIPSGAYVLGSYVLDWQNIKNDELYIVVSRSEGIVFKRVLNNLAEGNLRLKSDNATHENYDVAIQDVAEVWKAEGLTLFDFDAFDAGDQGRLLQEIKAMRKELSSLSGPNSETGHTDHLTNEGE